MRAIVNMYQMAQAGMSMPGHPIGTLLFLGPTGSGKSTVLDAICFALYGAVPRWGGTRGLAYALAPSATEARVRLVFESAGARYVATRVVRRDGPIVGGPGGKGQGKRDACRSPGRMATS